MGLFDSLMGTKPVTAAMPAATAPTGRVGQTTNPDGSVSYNGKTYTTAPTTTGSARAPTAAAPSGAGATAAAGTVASGTSAYSNVDPNSAAGAQLKAAGYTNQGTDWYMPGNGTTDQVYGTPDQQGAAARSAQGAATAAGNNQVNNPAVNPNLPNSTVPGSDAAMAAAPPTYGTQSGPNLMDQWFNERASGTDPGYEYATSRGLTSLDNAAAARGGFNGGASMQQDSDYLANMGSQREGQLDQLAGGAQSADQSQLNTMLGMGMGLAGGQAGLGAAYDTSGANAMSAANSTGLSLGAQGIGLQYGANQNSMNQLMGLGTLAALA